MSEKMSTLKQAVASPLGHCVLLGILAFVLLLPLSLIKDLVWERGELYKEATAGIAQNWGKAQTVSGPALVIPYHVWQERREVSKALVNGHEEPRETVQRELVTRYKIVLPAELAFKASLDTEVRYRGIYHQTLYTAPVAVSGSFRLPARSAFGDNVQRIGWGAAWFVLGVSDLTSIAETSPLQWAGQPLGAYQPGTRIGQILGPGFHVPVALSESEAEAQRSFALSLSLRGSGGIYFTPVGERTELTMQSAWPSPSFQGGVLPTERQVSATGFSASWNISNLTRTYPQSFDLSETVARNEDYGIRKHVVGVNLFEEVTVYRMVQRAVKYGLLFIVVTFTALFAFEMAGGSRVHSLQYLIVGLSMAMFYIVLLSLAEHVHFGTAFAAASALTVLMNSLYVKGVLQSWPKGCAMGVILCGLYTLLFSILQLEDFALLMGTALLVVMLGVLMYVTRRLPASL